MKDNNINTNINTNNADADVNNVDANNINNVINKWK